MKKFCSSCGNQLELSKRTCSECGATNPFFISNFTLLEDQSNELEKLRLEKEKIDRELMVKETAQAEFERQEQLRKELDELEKQKKETQEKERLIREALAQGPEAELKNELIRVKKETEQYKKETVDLLREMREELTQKIEEENKKIKKEMGGLVENRVVEKPETITASTQQQQRVQIPKANSGNNGMLVVVIIMLAILTTGIMGVFYLNQNHRTPVSNAQQPVESGETNTDPIAATDTVKNESNTTNVVDTNSVEPVAVKTALAEMPHPRVTNTAMIDSSKVINTPHEWLMTESKVKNDLVGKRLSGCNIVIHNSSEISNINHLALVEKLSTGYLKYKFNLTVKQENDVYTSIPYIYYTSTGHFLKVDGTNCE